MRVRVDGGNLIEGNRFSVNLTEKTPGNRFGSLTIRPGSNAVIGFRNSAGTALPSVPNGLPYAFPAGASTFQDFRLVLSKTNPAAVPPGDYLKLETFVYDATSGAYVSLGSVIAANVSSGIFNRLSLFSRNNGGRACFDSVMITQPKGSLPALPQGENTENIMFQDDFANANVKSWTNIATGGGKATIGIDPSGNGAGTWYPSVNSDGLGVGSEVMLPTDLTLAEGPIAVYMRVRLDSATGTYNNAFTIQLMEKSPNWRYAYFQILPGSTAFIARCNSGGSQMWTNLGANIAPALGAFVDLRMQLRDNGNGSMTIRIFRYDTGTSAYVSVGSAIADADFDSGIFNRLKIASYNGNGNGGSVGRAYFDSVMVTQVGSPRASSPANAYRLPLPMPAGVSIQSALDAYTTVVLGKGDYSGGAAFTLRSGQRLYGDPAGTITPPVTVEAGATGAVISSITVGGAGTVTFPASTTAVTRGCVFDRLGGRIQVNGGVLEDNLFLHTDGPISIDTSNSGYVRNNRFIRTKAHGWSNQLILLGDSQRNSYGNVFVWKNFLTPAGDSTNINNQGDLTFVGVDAESWNFNGTGTGAALWKVGSMGTLRIFGMNGGSNGGQIPANKTGIFDVNADEFQLYNDSMGAIGSPLIDYKLGANNLRSILVGSTATGKVWTSAASSPFRLKGFVDGWTVTDVSTSTSSTTTPAWTVRTGALPTSPSSPDEQAILRGMVVNPARIAGQVSWEAPNHGPIPDPAGPNWATDLAGKPDSTGYIQGLINATGVARLPAGIYYISQPLKLSRLQGIVGAGADTTVIIAKTNTLDMIVANDPVTTQTGTQITLADITLQGGGNGIHFDPVGTSANQGRFAQYTGCYINHVTFRNMSVAGIFMDQIYALDNIFFGYVHFVNCDTGLKQKVDPAYTGGENPTMMYMDKCVFYKSQFVGNRLALDLWGYRGCNLNAWINCLFENNSGGAAAMNNYLTTVFANCDFINNGGAAVLSNNYPVNHVSNGFVVWRGGFRGRMLL
jgi:hypothetical protein